MKATLTLMIVSLSLGLVATPAAHASNFCEHGGKKYSVHATRCEGGDRLRCVAKQTWKKIGTCPAPAPPRGPQVCRHGGKQYTIHATRCDRDVKLRCVAADTWKAIGRCTP